MTFEAAERIAAKPLFLVAFNLALAGVWIAIDFNAANFFISILTAELVLIGLGGARRSNLATQAKLDELIKANANARDELVRLEAEPEQTIEERRI